MSRLSGPLWILHTLLQTVTGLSYLCLSFQADCKHPLNICLVTLRRPKSHQKLSDGINLPLLLSLFIHFSQSLSQHFKTPKTRLISLSSSRWYNLFSLRECSYAMFHNISMFYFKVLIVTSWPIFLVSKEKVIAIIFRIMQFVRILSKPKLNSPKTSASYLPYTGFLGRAESSHSLLQWRQKRSEKTKSCQPGFTLHLRGKLNPQRK